MNFTIELCTMIVLASALVGALAVAKAGVLTWLFRNG
jgi:hypothetical protein